MDAPAELLPVLPALVAELEDLGARGDDVIGILEALPNHALGKDSRVLDLGCGKGAAALAIAAERGAQVLGVDGIDDFIEHARGRAEQLGLSSRCQFEVGDVRAYVEDSHDHDLVIMLALGETLGDMPTTIARLRGCVAPGGHMLIDGAYLGDESDGSDGSDESGMMDAYPSHEEARAELSSWGDVIVAERVVDGADLEAHYRGVTDTISQHARRLAAAHPGLAESILAFADRQRDAIETLGSPVVGCLWLLRRT